MVICIRGIIPILNRMAIEQWGLFYVSHLLENETTVNNGHLWGPVTLTPIVEQLAVELSLPILATYVCHGWDSNDQPSTCRVNPLTVCATLATGMMAMIT